MQKATCPQCGEVIGGESHKAVGGVERVGVGSQVNASGYVRERDAPSQNTASQLMCRLLMHLITRARLAMHLWYRGQAKELQVSKRPPGRSKMSAQRNSRVAGTRDQQASKDPFSGAQGYAHNPYLFALGAVERYRPRMAAQRNGRNRDDVRRCARLLGGTAALLPFEVALLVHDVACSIVCTAVRRVCGHGAHTTLHPFFQLGHNSSAVEDVIERSMPRNVQGIRARLEQVMQLTYQANATTFLGRVLKAMDADRLLSDVPSVLVHAAATGSSAGQLDATVWRARQAPTLAACASQFALHEQNEQHALLGAFLRVEVQLERVRDVVHVLNWHRVLFEAYPPGTLTREEAAQLCGRDAVERVTAGAERERAQRTLELYCAAFNRSFVLVRRLYQCEVNPFLAEDGSVDLSGASGTAERAVRMSADAPLIFSLPSMAHGENDATGLCTVQLLAHLQRIANAVHECMATTRLRAAEPTAADAAGQEGEREETTGAPIATISYRTPPQLLDRLVLDYRRERDFLPLLAVCAREQRAYDGSLCTNFDFGLLEELLCSRLLAADRPWAVQVHQYRFAGDVRRHGALSGLCSRIPQAQLSAHLLEAVLAELDTQDRVLHLKRVLDTCVRFVAAYGSEALGEQLLHRFVLDTLLLEPASWDAASCALLQRTVRLKHLEALYLFVDGQEELDVHPHYRAPLPAALRTQLLKVTPALHTAALLSTLRGVLEQLADLQNWAEADSPLKQLLSFVDMDLPDCAWYRDHFPPELRVAHAMDTYTLLLQQASTL
jgi:hypothetical protein